ncbi:MAG: riboflavin biosynthesis protein RibF [Saprospiraceae bacterium]|nr:riboflavin biosynthesis protein RibF [Saprospiraceae bacterium]
MVIHDGIQNLPVFQKAVITFGSFDGVHYGHRTIFSTMAKEAEAIGGETVVVTFSPHPRAVIYPNDDSLRLLSPREEKEHLFAGTGIDHLVICPFTVEFSQLQPDDYIENFIVKFFDPAIIVIGYDHRFGLNRQGDIHFLRSPSWSSHFSVLEIEQQLVDSAKVSSTKIRQHIEAGQLDDANELLGHPYLIHGKVVQGQKLGTKLGYPTANIAPSNPKKLVPADGVYAVRVQHEGVQLGGMLYIGNRPSIQDDNRKSIEVNLFDFHGDLYGQELMLELVGYVRGDMHFDALSALQEQLAHDKTASEALLRMVPKQLLSIVILNYNGLDYLKKFSQAVLKSLPDGKAELVVADNASTDESVAWLQEHCPDIRIIQLPRNLGFAGGYNEALKSVNATYALLLNSDVEVTPGWVEPLLSTMQSDKTIAACQPKVRSFHERSHFEYAGAAGGLIDALGYPFCRGRIMSNVEEDSGQYDQPKEVFWITGAAMCIRLDTFRQMGGFDASYFAHMEEIDLCWRLKRSGYRLVAIPDSLVYHVGGGTLSYASPRKTFLNFRNGFNTLLKNERWGRLLWLLPLRVLLDWVASVHFLFSKEVGNFASVWKAHLEVIMRLPSTLRERRTVNQKVEQYRIAPDRTHTGKYPGSIVYEYFVLGKRQTGLLTKDKSVTAT